MIHTIDGIIGLPGAEPGGHRRGCAAHDQPVIQAVVGPAVRASLSP